jgi:hypothetical protein
MAQTIIDKLYSDNASALEYLLHAKEISMYSDLDDKLKKVLVMSAASFFETELRSIIEAFVSKESKANAAVVALVKNKALERQFHTFFSWKERNGLSISRAWRNAEPTGSLEFWCLPHREDLSRNLQLVQNGRAVCRFRPKEAYRREGRSSSRRS